MRVWPGEMTQPYLVAFQHAEWRTRQILKKHAKRRPLGHLERQYNFMPRQPVLSCRSVNPVDVTGTRTYRAKSSSEIINEQHKLIHHIYTQITAARNAASAPVRSSNSSKPASSPRERPLRNLQVQGVTPRPKTSPAYRSVPNETRPTTALVSGLRRRPKTSICRKKAKPATDCYMSPDLEERYIETSEALQEINNVVKAQWEPENHSLKEGKFVKGKKKDDCASPLPNKGDQRLTFGGGSRDDDEGVVEAFTVMKSPDEYYTIDAVTGMQVARQVQRGDKVRIGRNGSIKAAGVELADWMSGSDKKEDDDVFSNDIEFDGTSGIFPQHTDVVPLCWQDQLNTPYIKVMEGGSPRPPPTRPNLCERHPVKFEKFLQDEPPIEINPRSNIQMPSKGGYKVTSRTKPRIGITGQESQSSTITNVTIGGMSDAEFSSVTYDDVLKQKLGNKPKPVAKRSTKNFGLVTTGSKASLKATSDSDTKNVNTKTGGGRKQKSPEVRSQSRQSTRDLDRDIPSQQSSHGSRPTTAHSGYYLMMSNSELEPLVIDNRETQDTGTVIASKSADNMQNLNTRAKSPLRSASASKLRASSVPLHKAVASTPSPSLIGQRGRVPEAEYIKIATQMPISKDGRSATPPKQDSSYIRAVSAHNRHTGGRDNFGEPPANDLHDEELDSTKAMHPANREGTSAPANSPPSSRALSPDTDYAFDIPTAGYLDDFSDVESQGAATHHVNQEHTNGNETVHRDLPKADSQNAAMNSQNVHTNGITVIQEESAENIVENNVESEQNDKDSPEQNDDPEQSQVQKTGDNVTDNEPNTAPAAVDEKTHNECVQEGDVECSNATDNANNLEALE